MRDFSIVIPVYNEAAILRRQVGRIVTSIDKLHFPVKYEIILVENGSTDNTCRVANRLKKKYKNLVHICLPFPSYGQAFKEGLRQASYPYVFQFDIDFWDAGFIQKAQGLLSKYDFVIGSKNLNGSRDDRPFTRRFISKLLEKIIDLRFGVSISDTHGLKAFKKSMTGPLIDRVICPNHFFDSELLLRAIRQGNTFCEIPVNLYELRSSRFSFLVRTKEVLSEFLTLMSVGMISPSRWPEGAPGRWRNQVSERELNPASRAINYISQLFV